MHTTGPPASAGLPLAKASRAYENGSAENGLHDVASLGTEIEPGDLKATRC